jgi:hypothetical protein
LILCIGIEGIGRGLEAYFGKFRRGAACEKVKQRGKYRRNKVSKVN